MVENEKGILKRLIHEGFCHTWEDLNLDCNGQRDFILVWKVRGDSC